MKIKCKNLLLIYHDKFMKLLLNIRYFFRFCLDIFEKL